MLLTKAEFIYYVIAASLAIGLVVVFFFIVLAVYLRMRLKRKDDLYHAINRTEENERNRIAQDLHDDINPLLSAIKLELESMADQHTQKKELSVIAQRLNGAIQEVRDLARSMSSTIVLNLGLVKGIEQFGNSICKSARIQFNLFYEQLPDQISDYAQSTIYRILQELLVNSIKHSGCTEINLSISIEANELFIEYNDNGTKGMASKDATFGMGLKNIASRVDVLRGQMAFPTDGSSNAHYTFTFPLKQLV